MESVVLHVYNARTAEDVARWIRREVGSVAQVEEWWRTRGPAWWAAVEPHWRECRRMIARWSRGELTPEDRRAWWARLGPTVEAAMEELLSWPERGRWTLAGWFWRERETEPLGILREAYRQMIEGIVRERWGLGKSPRLCGVCGRAFLPDRVNQRWCSSACRNRIGQRAARARARERAGGAGEDGRGSDADGAGVLSAL
jgi:hypothetical protein